MRDLQHISEEELLMPLGQGVRTKYDVMLRCAEHAAKCQKVITSSSAACQNTVARSAWIRSLPDSVGPDGIKRVPACNNTKRVTCVCAGDPQCPFHSTWAHYVSTDRWVPLSWHPHEGCTWSPKVGVNAAIAKTHEAKVLRAQKYLDEAVANVLKESHNYQYARVKQHCQDYLAKLQEVKLVEVQADTSQSYRPYSPIQLAHGLTLKYKTDEPTPEQVNEYLNERCELQEKDSNFRSRVVKAMRQLYAEQSQFDDINLLPEYIQALNDLGHFASMETCSVDEMRESIAHLIQREYDSRKERHPEMEPVKVGKDQVSLNFGGAPPDENARYVIGWSFSPKNTAPIALIPDSNQATRSEVVSADACHMKTVGNEGTLYAFVKWDADHQVELIHATLKKDIENNKSWEQTFRHACEAEPSINSDYLPHKHGDAEPVAPTPAKGVIVVDGTKGATGWKRGKRCARHLIGTLAKGCGKGVQTIARKAIISANKHEFDRWFSKLSETARDKLNKVDEHTWKQCIHQGQMDGVHDNVCSEVMNNAWMPVRKQSTILGALHTLAKYDMHRFHKTREHMKNNQLPLYPPKVSKLLQESEYRIDQYKQLHILPEFHCNNQLSAKVRSRRDPSVYHTCTLHPTGLRSPGAYQVSCSCGHNECDGIPCDCARLMCKHSRTYDLADIMPRRFTSLGWRHSMDMKQTYDIPQMWNLANVDASALRKQHKCPLGIQLLPPPAIPKQGGRPKKEYYVRQDAFTARKKRMRQDQKMTAVGTYEEKKATKCHRCGVVMVNNHNSHTCEKMGFVEANVNRMMAGTSEGNTSHQVASPPESESFVGATSNRPQSPSVGITSPHSQCQNQSVAQSQNASLANTIQSSLPLHVDVSHWCVPLGPLSAEELQTYEQLLGYDFQESCVEDILSFQAALGRYGTSLTLTREDIRRLDYRLDRVFFEPERLYMNDGTLQMYCHLLNDLALRVWSKDESAPKSAVCRGAGFFFKKMTEENGIEGLVTQPKKPNSGWHNARWLPRPWKLVDLSSICFPLNNPGAKHWSLVVLNLVLGRVELYDSGGDINKYLGEQMASMLLQWFELEIERRNWWTHPNIQQLTGPLGKPTSWQIIHKQRVPQQHNGHDCGIFVCKFIHQIILGKCPTGLEGHIQIASQSAALRGRIAADLEAGCVSCNVNHTSVTI